MTSQRKRLVLFAVSVVAALGIACTAGAGSVAADNLFQGVCNQAGNPSDSVACTQNGADKISGPNGLLGKVTNIIALVSGVVAVLFVLIGGFKYVTSGGDSGKAQEARNTIMYALVGLVVIVLARSIILFVISKV